MRLSWAAMAGALMGLALILPACGEDRVGAAGQQPSNASTVAASTKAKTSAEIPAPPGASCRARLHRLLGSMDVLRDRLARGLSYDEYLREVQGLRAAYGEIEASELPLSCLLASAAPGERAFNSYIDAANAWGNCLATVSCDTASIEPRLQVRWADASAQLSAAQRGLPHEARG
jgi:hypothetical protein